MLSCLRARPLAPQQQAARMLGRVNVVLDGVAETIRQVWKPSGRCDWGAASARWAAPPGPRAPVRVNDQSIWLGLCLFLLIGKK